MPLFARKPSLAATLFLALLAACHAEPPQADDEAVIEPDVANIDPDCGEHGKLETRVFGSIETTIRWSGSEMQCESMLRPDNEGVRLRFSGDIGNERFALIVAIPAIERDIVRAELSSNVTATVEGSGRFFSTANLDTCWTDIDVSEAVSDERSMVSGRLYCVAPLGEVNGSASISLDDMIFTTTIDWGK